MKKAICFLSFVIGLGMVGCASGGSGNGPAETADIARGGTVVSAIHASSDTEAASGVFAWEVRQQSTDPGDGGVPQNDYSVVGLDRKGAVVFSQTIQVTSEGSETTVTAEVTVPGTYKFEVGPSGERHDLVPATDPKISTMISRFAADMETNKTAAPWGGTSQYSACSQAAEYAFDCSLTTAACAEGMVIACSAMGYYCYMAGHCATYCYYGYASCT